MQSSCVMEIRGVNGEMGASSVLRDPYRVLREGPNPGPSLRCSQGPQDTLRYASRRKKRGASWIEFSVFLSQKGDGVMNRWSKRSARLFILDKFPCHFHVQARKPTIEIPSDNRLDYTPQYMARFLCSFDAFFFEK